jgi:hypothetical protein
MAYRRLEPPRPRWPLVAFALAPEATPVAIGRFRAWMSRNGGKALVTALTVIGLALILRGTVAIAT